MFWPVSVTGLILIALLSTSGRIFKYRRVLILGRKMLDCKSEWVNIKFLVKLKKFTTETFKLLTEAYGEDCMSRARVFEWHKWFLEGRESLKDDDRPGCARTAVTDDNIEKVRDVIRKDHQLGVRAVAEEVNLDRESVWWILRIGMEHEKGLCKNGSRSAVRWTKRTLQGIVFGPFATHWEWTRFVEFDNYLWWYVDIYVWSGHQATISAVEVNIISKTKKHACVIRSSRPCWLFSLISRVLW